MSFTIRQARVHKGMTQLEMARVLKVSEQTYRRYENSPGRMPAEALDRLSKATNIPISMIVIRREEETQENKED